MAEDDFAPRPGLSNDTESRAHPGEVLEAVTLSSREEELARSYLCLALAIAAGSAYYVAALVGLESLRISGWFVATLYFPPTEIVYPLIAAAHGRPASPIVLGLLFVSVLFYLLGASAAREDLELP